mgnify:CR=1 FL=1|jgi:polyhydroxyalkanoate synthesis regulator phasin
MDVVKKAMLLGLGVISLTKEKAEEAVDDLIKRGEATLKKYNDIVIMNPRNFEALFAD